MNLAKKFMVTGVVAVLIGMGWGLQMSISGDHAMAPAHAHLNLFGFVTMSIYAIYYAITPKAAAHGMAGAHYWVSLVAIIVFAPGIALAIAETTEIFAKIGSVLVVVSMLMFLAIVLKSGIGKE